MISGRQETILGCDLQRIVHQYVWIRHLIAFLVLLFFLVLTNDSAQMAQQTFFQKTFVAVSAYVLFLLFCKTEGHFTLVLLLLIMLQYFINTYVHSLRERNALAAQNTSGEPSPEDAAPVDESYIKVVNQVEYAVYVLMMVLLFIGVLAYIGKQSYKRKEWSWVKFIFGRARGCNLRRKFVFGTLSGASLWKEIRMGVEKVSGV